MASNYLQIFTSHMERVISSYLHANQEEEKQILTPSTYYTPDTVHIMRPIQFILCARYSPHYAPDTVHIIRPIQTTIV
jgi:hypothetical protein